MSICAPFYLSYAPNQRCQWLITVDSEKYIELHIHQFDLHDVDKSCQRDFLDIYDYDISGQSTRVGRYCKLVWPPRVSYSSWDKLTLHFVSDFADQGKGFNASYFARGNEIVLQRNLSGGVGM